ncbi:PCC domain-containing protein [Krasilnikovia sp. M28-CT-15]|uniref:PCC domain-containing protein n=1 Tax=Krasilnikovia sp. M28-CT-15 TaxID=3373540 RepID=UPI0038766524
MFLVTVEKDQEVVETVGAAVAARGVRNGSISLIGAVQECTVSVMNKDDALFDRLRSYDQPFELTGTGEVVDGSVHLHVVLAGEDVTAAGHLHRAVVRDFFVRAYISPLDQAAN